MLFNSLPFLFGFLPIALAGFFALSMLSPRVAGAWLAAASLFFYGWWNINFVPLLLASIGVNFVIGSLITRMRRDGADTYSRIILIIGIAANLILLGYFKYASFFVSEATRFLGATGFTAEVALPLGISFFTFTQIAFLVDTHQGKAKEYDFLYYILFVSYFPHLIAGPIIHHKQIMPQFGEARTYRPDATNLSVGLTIFVIGLAKKVLIADAFGGIATPIFGAVDNGSNPAIVEAWAGALAYTLQLYFDFSGYSDMAIGLSRLFNIHLPLNFNSPYKAVSIIEFWRRWHMTLSSFLRDYLYIPLGGNRYGAARRYFNLFITMLLGGLWHGAGWTFIAWGTLHGIYLLINHAFHGIGWRPVLALRPGIAAVFSGAATFIAVVIAWVLFRSKTFAGAVVLYKGMIGASGISLHKAFPESGVADSSLVLILMGLAIVWVLPNTQEFFRLYAPPSAPITGPSVYCGRLVWTPEAWQFWLPLCAALALAVLGMAPSRVSEFPYYQF